MRKLFGFNKEKDLFSKNEQQTLILKEYKYKLKFLVSDNEELKSLIKTINDSLNNFKAYLSEIGISNKNNQINTSRNFHFKFRQLVEHDNNIMNDVVGNIKSEIETYLEQLKELNLSFEQRNYLTNENVIVDDQIFILKNIYLSKESQIMNLQTFIRSCSDSTQEITFEYHYFDEKTVTCCMDHFMAGIRSEMANSTRLLNIEQNKVLENERMIEDKKKEIEDIKNTKVNTPPTQITQEAQPLPNDKNTMIKKKKQKLKRADKIEIIKKLTNDLQHELNSIELLDNEINTLEEENNSLKQQAEEKNTQFSNKYSEIISLELHLDKLKKDLLRIQTNVK